MPEYLASLSQIGLDDVSRAGGKAANLGELTRAGFSVPQGFCVLGESFDTFLDANDLQSPIQEIAASIDYKNLSDIEEKSARIRAFFHDAPMPHDLARDITEAYGELHSGGLEPLVAVRSSVGTRDLSRSSFPGQMDTFYNVRGIQQVLEHIKQCWASIWTARAAATLHATGIAHNNVLIAPVVQTMVQADTAGVVFTSNPESASMSEMLIDAAPGLGEAVVGGNISPDHYVVCKESSRVLSEVPGNKSFKIELDDQKGQGVRKVMLPESRALASCLDPDKISRLRALAQKIEKHYGIPQDVEWAFADGDLYVLQSRKIGFSTPKPEGWTSEFDTPLKNPPETYTSSNIGEVLPGVLTPLAMSLLKGLDYGFWKANHDVGMIDTPFPEADFQHVFLGFYYGRAHLNLTAFKSMISRVPGLSLSEFDRSFPEEDRQEEDASKWSLRALPFILKVVVKSALVQRRTPKNLEYATHAILDKIKARRESGYAGKSETELLKLIDENTQEGMDIMALHIANSQLAVFYYEMLAKLTKRWMGDEQGVLASQLVTGLASLESSRPNFGMYSIYQFVAGSRLLRKIFLESDPSTLIRRLENMEDDRTREFMGMLDSFLEEYGYRSVFEGEIMVKSWEQDPSFVLSMIQNFLQAEHVDDPRMVEKRQQALRIHALGEVQNFLPWHKRKVLNTVLKNAQKFIPGRENNKAIVVKGINEAKILIRKIAQHLLLRNLLSQEDDIFFLTMPEIRDLVLGKGEELEHLIDGRKIEYEKNKNAILPVTFTGRPIPQSPAEPVIPASGALKGLSVSPGRVTGPARVIMDPRSNAKINSGEILVAPVTDASWTPLFLLASAIVVDVGGLLSHGSVIAREFGIPGVLNVLKGTQVIKTGQIITVDGFLGQVYLHDNPTENKDAEKKYE